MRRYPYRVRDEAMRKIRGSSGITLVEILIAMFIAAIISTAIYALYTNFFRQATTQDLMLEAQQNARVAINLMERELVNAGYAAGTVNVITEATATSFEFIYTDPETDPAMSATAGRRLKVRYALQTVGGVQYLTRKADILTAGNAVEQAGNVEKIIPYVQSLSFTYNNLEGTQLVSTASQAERNTIMFITVQLTTRTRDTVQGTGNPETFMVETHVRLRNIGIGQAALDTTPPSAPATPQVRDPGLCDRLKVKWTKNTEGDIAGYKIYFGTTSGSYTGVVNVPINILSGSTYSCTQTATEMQCSIYPVTPALTNTPSNAVSPTVYYMALKAYDNSLNHSNFSSEVSGNPDPSNATFDVGTNDSTVNPAKPVAVSGLTAADGALDNQVALSWGSYNTTDYPDVVGFRLYRSASQFTTYPIDPTTPGIDWIAGEPGSGKPELTETFTGFTDTGAGLVGGLLGCKKYYYAIAPVNCDPTLISDEGSDPASKKYVQTDYNATCGDGATACSAGTGFASVTGSDTAPRDSTVPAAPTLGARAGWKRVAVSLTQPSNSDLSQTCIYSNEGASYPALRTDTATYPKELGCYQVNTFDTPGAIRLYEDGGIFTVAELPQSQSTSFWHYSMTGLTTTPSLLETGTYKYRAISFDLCGNGSAVDAAQATATTTLCGEDPPSGEKPPAATNLTSSACASPAGLTWTGVSSDIGQTSTPTNPWDLAGYRIFRNTASGDWSSSALLNPAAPYWGTSYSDNTVTDGGTYYYRVVTTDCPYERVNPPAATIRSDMISNYLKWVQTGPVYPGRIDRDEKCPGAGSCTKDDHREVLTGVAIDNTVGNGTGVTTPDSDFRHGKVTLFFNNTSAGTMTITGVSVSWVNTSAFLRKVTIGGGRSGVGQTFTDIAQGLTTTVTGNPPYTRAVSNATISSAQISAGARYVPITFTFKDAAGSEVDMRDDTLLVTLNVRNDSTGTTSCVSYLTVSQSSEGVFVPFGPSVTAAQQNRPSSPTFGFAVPGPTGLNTVPSGSEGSIVVDASLTVTVSANILGNTTDETTGGKVPISSAKLFYAVTAKTVTTAPTTGFTQVNMTNTGGNVWSGAIPANDGFRVWYYILATDSDGNWDRDPEIDHGAYVYDQKTFNACDVTPSAPTNLAATVSTDDVTLTWTATSTYTNSASIHPTDTIRYRVFRGSTQIADNLSATTYTDNNLAAGVYTYTVRAYNSCPVVSSASNTAAACVGLSGQFDLTVSPTSITQGGSYNVAITDCLAANGAYATTIETINVSASFTGFSNTSSVGSYNPTIAETGLATAYFPKTITTTDNPAESGKLLVARTDTITVTYAPPGITAQSRTVTVASDPCADTPKAPATLGGSVQGQNMTLTWSAVTQNTDNSVITDLAGYRVYEKVCAKDRPNCTGADIVADWFLRTSVGGAATSTTVSSDQGSVSQRIYYFKVRAFDTCGTPIESSDSPVWNETN